MVLIYSSWVASLLAVLMHWDKWVDLGTMYE